MAAPSPRAPDRRWVMSADLFTRWRCGDSGALDQLVRTSTPSLWHLARAYGLERHAAEDVVQTTWMALVRHGDQIEDARTVSAWLATTTRREAWRVARAASKVTVADEHVFDTAAVADPPAEDSAHEEFERRHLWDAVVRLSHRCQRLLRVIAFDDRPDYRRLASELDMPIGSVGPTRGRCLAKLRTLLQPGADA